MSEVGFTKGPWAIDAGFDGNEGDFEQYWQVHDGQDAIACSSSCFAGNRKANAHLIAAAPELYEALDNALDILSYDQRDYVKDIVTECKMALAKARGENP